MKVADENCKALPIRTEQAWALCYVTYKSFLLYEKLIVVWNVPYYTVALPTEPPLMEYI